MAEFFPFFLILVAAVFFSEVFRRLHLPWVIALILAGIVIGPYGVEAVELNPTIEFLGQVGLVFLMFMAGLESRIPVGDGSRPRIIILGIINSMIPLAVGVGLTWWLGYSWSTAALVGITFVSSSVAVIIPTLEANNLLSSSLGRLIVPTTVMQDVLSLVLLSLLLHTLDPVTPIPLPIFYVLLFLLLVTLRWLVPRIEWLFRRWYDGENDTFQQELRVVLTILLGTVIVFEVVGLHPIIAGFFAGLILSDTVKSDQFKDKLRAISYGVFIPLFFVVIGMRTDISVFQEAGPAVFATIAVIVGGSVLAKFISGWFGAHLIRRSSAEAGFIGAATIPQLSTTLAVVTSGMQLGILPPVLATSLIILSIVTTVISPIMLNAVARHMREESRGQAAHHVVR